MAIEKQKKSDIQIPEAALKIEDWSKINPKEGISHLDVVSHNIGNIPGAIQHWESELKKRRQEILDWNNRSVVKKATDLIGSNKNISSKRVGGEDIADYHPIAPIQKLVQELKKDPIDYNKRIRLVSAIAENNKGLSVEAHRNLLIQAAVANTFGFFSIPGIHTANAAQTSYLQSLQAKCRHDSRILKLRLEKSQGSNNAYDQQKDQFEKIKSIIDRNVDVLNTYINHAEKGSDITKYPFNDLFNIKETINDAVMGTNDQRAETEVFLKANAIINYLRYNILLLPYAHEVSDLLIKIDAQHPLGYFLKGRTHMSDMIFQISKYEITEKSEKDKKNMQQLFKTTYHYYAQAVKKAGGHYDSGSKELTILLEYVSTLRYFINTVATTIKLTLPKSWVIDNLYRATKLLQQTGSDDKQINHMFSRLQHDLEGWK